MILKLFRQEEAKRLEIMEMHIRNRHVPTIKGSVQTKQIDPGKQFVYTFQSISCCKCTKVGCGLERRSAGLLFLFRSFETSVAIFVPGAEDDRTMMLLAI